ncbi:MAG: AAA family ATPase [Polyangiaceae bacterium]|nr:AAA family ATPase [Polyangiaceae bacterium]
MATKDQLKALIKCHADGDNERFYAVAMQVAAQEARGGHGRFAQELRELIDKAKDRPPAGLPVAVGRPVPVVQPRGELAGLLGVAYPKTRLADMVLSDALRGQLDRVILEQRQQLRLQEHGFGPTRKLLLVGPPGTGKTMTAAALAGELGIALFTIQLDGLITKFMGETAAKLRLIFEAIAATRAAYFFDEFDALGGDRGSKNDVGEIRRVLNSFLQFLEQDESQSLIIGATNHVSLLDRALFRRFDAVVDYALPSPDVAQKVIRARLGSLNIEKVGWGPVRKAAAGLSHAELAKACDQAAKNAILAETTVIETRALVAALVERQAART